MAVVVGYYPRRHLIVGRPLELTVVADERLAERVAAAHAEVVDDAAHIDAEDRARAIPTASERKARAAGSANAPTGIGYSVRS